MARVYEIMIEPMTEESFRPFGELMAATEWPKDHRQFFRVDFQADGEATVSALWQPYETLTFTELERHFAVTQSFVQLSGSPAVVCAAAPTDRDDPESVPNPEDVHAFLIDPTKGFAFKNGTWHSLNRYILAPPGATFLIINSNPNPTQMVDYEKSVGLTYTDLGRDKNPTKVDFKGKFGVTFKVAL